MNMKTVAYSAPKVSSMSEIELLGTFMWCLTSDNCGEFTVSDNMMGTLSEFRESFPSYSNARYDNFCQQPDKDREDYVARLLFWEGGSHALFDTPDWLFSVCAEKDTLLCSLRKAEYIGTNTWHYNKVCSWELSPQDIKEIF